MATLLLIIGIVAGVALAPHLLPGADPEPLPGPPPARDDGGDEQQPLAAAGPDFVLRTWAAVNEMPSYSPDQRAAVDDATRFDLLTALRPTYAGDVAAMKRANSGLDLLVYMNGSYAQRDQEYLYPEDWYSRDANGLKVRSLRYGTFLMNPSHPGWVSERASTCAAFMAESGYEGCFVDDLGSGSLHQGVVSGLPINPATGQEWTAGEWVAATARIAEAVQTEAGAAVVIGNGLGNGSRYFGGPTPASVLLDHLDGGIAEAWLRNGMAPLHDYPSEGQWVQDVDLLVDAERKGKTALTLTKTWADGTQEQKDAWYVFALASFLLGAGEHAHFGFSYGPDVPPTSVTHPDDLDLGGPLQPYQRRDGAYQREFERGRVLVNPTPLHLQVELGETLTNSAGEHVDRIALGPYGGAILTRP